MEFSSILSRGGRFHPPPLPIMDGMSDARSFWVSLTSCFLAISFTFQCLCWLWPSGLTYLWGGLRWMFLGVWGLPGTPIWRGLFQLCPPTMGAACWFYVPEPWTPDAPVYGPHQSDDDNTLDISARPRVGLLTLCCEAYVYPFHGSPRLHNQYPINRINKCQ